MDLSSRLNKACYAIKAIKPFMSLSLICTFNIIVWYVWGGGVMNLIMRVFSKFKKE
jgi:hypothetical protein